MEIAFAPDAALVDRFAAGLDCLIERGSRVGIAVSGGPDSLALLLLAAAARPGLIAAATVDHRLRPESRSEARMVARVCDGIAVPHSILPADTGAPTSNLQAWARALRYRLLAGWAAERGLDAIATAHHLDDQAETFLMRLARGSGVGGLAGVQPSRRLGSGVRLVRPLLGWRRHELSAIVAAAGLDVVDDPSNSDDRFDRSRVRRLIESSNELDARRVAAAAGHCADAEDALAWTATREFEARCTRDDEFLSIDAAGLPRELRRRLLLRAIETITGEQPPGPKLMAALDTLEAGGTTTLAGLKLTGGRHWRLAPAPPRESRSR